MPRKISEVARRKQMIDPQLEQAGWYIHSLTNFINSKIYVNGQRELQSTTGEELDALLPSVLDRAFRREL